MTMGKEKCTLIIAIAYNLQAVAVRVPEKHKEAWDWILCGDNGMNESELPQVPGLYEVECELCWDDGKNYFGEASDCEWDYTVLSVKPLWQVPQAPEEQSAESEPASS